MPTFQCGTLRERPNAHLYGYEFANQFHSLSVNQGYGEIVLFRRMQDSIVAAARLGNATVEEFHGNSHQVAFDGDDVYSRKEAKCELCDLMVVIYDDIREELRMTLIQAKSERDVRANSLGIVGQSLKANTEQWYLLANKPLIKGVGKFNPPERLLSDAQLDSIGCFVFFLQDNQGNVTIQYSCAGDLSPKYKPKKRKVGRLIVPADACICGQYPECRSAYGNLEFGAFLYGMMIGTPVYSHGDIVDNVAATWLSTQLKLAALAATSQDRPTQLANEILRLLPEASIQEGDQGRNSLVSNIVVMKVNHDRERIKTTSGRRKG